MELNDYFKEIKDISFILFKVKEDKAIKLHLIAPVGKKNSLSWTLVIGGRFYARLNPWEGTLFYEFMYQVKERGNPILTKEILLDINKIISKKVSELYKEVLIDTISERFSLMTDEINRYINSSRLKGEFTYIYPYTYSIRYKRPSTMKLSLDSFSKGEIHELLNHFENNKVFKVVYPNSFLDNINFEEYLSYKNCFYNVLDTNGVILNPKNLIRLHQAGLDEIIIPMNSNNSVKEYNMTGNNIKDLVLIIKQAIKAGLKVTVNTLITESNQEYYKLVKSLHEVGVKSFMVSFTNDLENRDIILKQAYYYTNINGLDLSIETKGVIKETQLKRIKINPGYKENYVSYYYATDSFSLFLDLDKKYPVGNLSTMSLAECYMLKRAKQFRKENLKRWKYEKK